MYMYIHTLYVQWLEAINLFEGDITIHVHVHMYMYMYM